MNASERTTWVVEQARALGFDACGVASVEDYAAALARLPEWLGRGYAGEMAYLRDPRRLDARRVLAQARSVVVCALNYNTPLPYSTEIPREAAPRVPSGAGAPGALSDAPRGWISRYAWGDDYHQILGEKLDALLAAMRAKFFEPFDALGYVDTGPVVERAAAQAAGLGWLGKNTCLIHEELGSWLFLGVIVTTLELAPSVGPAEAPPADLCGQCTLCIEACPTGAIVEPYVLDARRCISYLTIELRGTIPEEFRAPMGRHVFGCDICQDVCPWNRKAPRTNNPAWLPRTFTAAAPSETQGETAAQTAARRSFNGGASGEPDRPGSNLELRYSLFCPSLEWLLSLTEDEFRTAFRNSALRRTKWRGLMRNACIALGNSGLRPGDPGYSRVIALLERLAQSDDAGVAQHAAWALGLCARLGTSPYFSGENLPNPAL